MYCLSRGRTILAEDPKLGWSRVMISSRQEGRKSRHLIHADQR